MRTVMHTGLYRGDAAFAEVFAKPSDTPEDK